MNSLLTIGLMAASICVVALLWFIFGYNRFVRLKSLLDEAWSGIDIQLKRRYDLIPNLVTVVKQYSIHEQSVLENIAKARSASMNATGIAEKASAEANLTGTLKTLFAVAENYPQLKANENYMGLQRDLSSLENDIQLARRYYNGTARNYNIMVQSLPSSLIANIANFKKVPYFELSNPVERENQRVEF